MPASTEFMVSLTNANGGPTSNYGERSLIVSNVCPLQLNLTRRSSVVRRLVSRYKAGAKTIEVCLSRSEPMLCPSSSINRVDSKPLQGTVKFCRNSLQFVLCLLTQR